MPSSTTSANSENAAIFMKLYASLPQPKTEGAQEQIINLIADLPTSGIPARYNVYYEFFVKRCFQVLGRMSAASKTTGLANRAELYAHLAKAYAFRLSLLADIGQLIDSVCNLDELIENLTTDRSNADALASSIRARVEQLCDSVANASETTSATLSKPIETQHVNVHRTLLVVIKLEFGARETATPVTFNPLHTVAIIASLKRCIPAGCELRFSLNVILIWLQVCRKETSADKLAHWMRRLPPAKSTITPVDESTGAKATADTSHHHWNTVLTASQLVSSVLKTVAIETLSGHPDECVRYLEQLHNLQQYFDDGRTATLSFSRQSCLYCKSNVLQHESIALGETAVQLVKSMLTANVAVQQAIDKDQVVRFLSMYGGSWRAACSLQLCNQATFFRQKIQAGVRNVIADLQSLQRSDVAWLYIQSLCRTFGAKIVEVISEQHLVRALCVCAPTVRDVIIIRYIYASHLLSRLAATPSSTSSSLSSSSSSITHNLTLALYQICQQQNQLDDIVDIGAHFDSIAYTWHGWPIPPLDANELLLRLLQVDTTWTVLTPDHRHRLIVAIVQLTPADRPWQALRASNTFHGNHISDANVYDGLRAAYLSARRNYQNELNQSATIKRRWYAIVGNMETIEYLRTVNSHSERTINTAIEVHEFGKNAPLFRKEMNATAEADVLRRLHSALHWYGKFVTKITTDVTTRNDVDAAVASVYWTFGAELLCTIKTLIQIVDHCAVRDFRVEAYQSCWMLLQLIGGLQCRRITTAPTEASASAAKTIATFFDELCVYARLQVVAHLAANRSECGGEPAALAAAVRQCIDEDVGNVLAQPITYRKYGIALEALLSVVLYRADTGGHVAVKDMMLLAERHLNTMEQRYALSDRNPYRIRHQAVLLRLVTHYELHPTRPPIELAESLMALFGNLDMSTVHNTLRLRCLLYEVQRDVAVYCLVRYDYSEIKSVLRMLLKMAIRERLALRAYQNLMLLSLQELYEEKADVSECILGLLDVCLGLEAPEVGQCNGMDEIVDGFATKMLLDPTVTAQATTAHAPTVRQQQRLSPYLQRQRRAGYTPVNKYLLEHHNSDGCKCARCASPGIRNVLRDASVQFARGLHIRGDREAALRAYEQAQTYWTDVWQQHQPTLAAADTASTTTTAPKRSTCDAEAMTMCRLCDYHAQSLRMAGRTGEAAAMLQTATTWLMRCSHPDPAVLNDLRAQQIAMNGSRECRSRWTVCGDFSKVLLTAAHVDTVYGSQQSIESTKTKTTTKKTDTIGKPTISQSPKIRPNNHIAPVRPSSSATSTATLKQSLPSTLTRIATPPVGLTKVVRSRATKMAGAKKLPCKIKISDIENQNPLSGLTTAPTTSAPASVQERKAQSKSVRSQDTRKRPERLDTAAPIPNITIKVEATAKTVRLRNQKVVTTSAFVPEMVAANTTDIKDTKKIRPHSSGMSAVRARDLANVPSPTTPDNKNPRQRRLAGKLAEANVKAPENGLRPQRCVVKPK